MNPMKALANPQFLSLQPYTAGKAIDELRREHGLSDIIKLSSNENPYGASDEAIQACHDAATQIHRYPDSQSHYLKNALTEFLNVSSDQLILGNGSDEIFGLLMTAFTKTGDEIITAEYAFAQYEIGARVRHLTPVIATTKDYAYDLNAMLSLISDKTKLIFIANPNNPTGSYVSDAKLHHFLKQVPGQILVVVDEAYFEYARATDYPNTLNYHDEFPNVVTTRTFSKVYGLAGLRAGYAIAHPDISNILSRIRLPFNLNAAAQKAAIAALHAQYHVESSVINNEKNRVFLEHTCKTLQLRTLPSAANFITVDVSKPALPIYQALLKEGVIVRPLDNYNMPNHLRMTIGTEKECARLAQALTRVLQQS